MKRVSLSLILCTVLGLLLVPTAFAQHLVISQIYGGGGNTGAPYKNDFIELYNPTDTAINLGGYSVQYASATGTTWSGLTQLSGTIPPHDYFLIAEGGGSNGVALPTADLSGTINMSATAGKVALVNSASALPSGCPTGATVVDLVGYGTTANCFEGATAPAPSNTTSIIRNSNNDDTNNNATDFTTTAPNPRNTSFNPPVYSLSASGDANPATVTAGDTVLLTVNVTPASSPASTNIQVVGSLTSIGGAAAQTFYDDGTHGDVTAGDNLFSFSTAVTTATNGPLSLPISVTDAQGNSASTTISLAVSQPVHAARIHEIQGTSPVSPYDGLWVQTSGIVTGVGSVGFFVQSRDSEVDSDPNTPEGIYVYAGNGKVPSSAVIGNELRVIGQVATYPAVTASHTPATEIISPTIALLSTGNTLPAPVTLTTSILRPDGGLYQLTRYEGMRVLIPSLTSVSATDGSLSEATETVTSNGRFYAVITGTARPFREPGVDIRDTLPSDAPANIARFDDNPERILVDSKFLGGPLVDLATGAILTNVTGVLDFTYSSDSYYDPSRLLLDATYDRANITGGMTVQPLAAATDKQFTVAAFNVERFFNTDPSDNIEYNPVTQSTGKSSAVNVTSDAYARRLAKVSLAIRQVLGSPDIVSLEEVENRSVVADIAARISADAVAAGEPDPQYAAYGTGTDYAPYTNDPGGISIGFLVKPARVNTVSIVQAGPNMLMTDPRDEAKLQTLNDRPPLVLHAGIKRPGATDYPVTVISNHLRSLSSINDPSSGVFVREKKEKQAEYLAGLIQEYQSAGKHVVAVGDYNVFEFSDGFTDVMATVTGQNFLPDDQVMRPGAPGLVTPPATDLVTLLPANQRWSYSESGNAQVLDHVVATSDLVAAGAYVAYVHSNADMPLIAYNDATTAARVSDHDPAVGYFALPDPVLSATLTPSSGDFGTLMINQESAGQVFTVKNTGETDLSVISISATTDYSKSDNCGGALTIHSSCDINVVFRPTAEGSRPGTLTVVLSSGTYTAPLTGTGRLPTLSATLTPATADFGSVIVTESSTAQAFTVTNTGEATLTVASISVGSDYLKLNDCAESMTPGSSCNLNVVFKPTTTGSRPGTLTVVLNSGTYSASLSGTGIARDFAVAGTGGSTSIAIRQGSSGGVSLTFSPVNGFNGTISLACAPSGVAPSGVTCNVPQPFAMNGSTPVTQTVTFSTTPNYVANSRSSGSRSPWMPTLAFAVFALFVGSVSCSRRKIVSMAVLLAILAACLLCVGCGGKGTATNPNGTATGTYVYTVTATSGAISHAQTVTLIVQ